MTKEHAARRKTLFCLVSRFLVRVDCLMAIALLLPHAGQAATYRTLYNFTGSSGDGEQPEQAPVEDAAGALYGTVSAGGQYGFGGIYKLTPVTKNGPWAGGMIYSFNHDGVSGVYPKAGLLQGAGGVLYGTTYTGGANDQGTAFAFDPSSGTMSVLFDFSAAGGVGSLPLAGLVLDTSGVLYGTTESGGADNAGVVFQLVNTGGARWTENVLHSFSTDGVDGTLPQTGPLAMDAKGNLYGTTYSGGANNGGVAYEISPPKQGTTLWTETILHDFGGAGDGATLEGGLVFGKMGVLYGATDGGGAGDGQGTIFSLSPPTMGQKAWTETVLYTFQQGGPLGSYPRAGVTWNKAGAVFALTNAGGTNGLGTVFRLAKDGTASELHEFSAAHGNKVFGYLTEGKGGTYFGVTYDGGTGGYGVVFSIKP
jgi:uncharacterized repeat protein (TIGR03803 family)